MFKLKYKGQEVGLDKDCRIEWGSVETDASDSPAGWCATHEEMDESSRRLQELLESLIEEGI
jgi:hypothetical protein